MMASRRYRARARVRDANAAAQARDGEWAEAPYRMLFEANPLPMCIYDTETLDFLAVNEAAITHYGYSRTEFLQINGRDLLSTEDLDRYGNPIRHEETQQWSGRARHRTKDGTFLDVDITSTAITFMGHAARLAVAIDVTEQWRMHASLEASERRFRALIEKSADAIALVDAEGTMLYTGPSTERVLGYRPDEIIGTNTFAFIHPEDREHAASVMGVILDTPGASASAQYRIRRKDGSWLWMEGAATNYLDDPMIGAIVGNYRDISERKQAENAAQESEQRFRALVEKSWDAMTVMDVDGAVRYVSPSTTRILGYLPEELIGRTLNHLLHPDDVAERAERGDVMIAGGLGTTIASEMRLRHKNGGFRWLETVTTNLLEDPAIRGFVANFRDTTERKQAEEALRFAEQRYRSLVEQIPVTVYLATPDSVGSTIYVSPQREELLGYPTERWMEDPAFWLSVIHPDDRERLQAILTRANETGTPMSLEYRYIAADGRIVWVRDEAVLVRDSDGEPIYWQGVNIDITERKQAEETLRASEERLRAQYQGNPVATYTWQRAGDDWRFIDYNRAADAITDGMIGGLIGRLSSDLYRDLPGVREALMRCDTEQRTIRQERSWTFAGTGQQRDLIDSFVPVPPDLVVLHSEDITERKQAEEQLRYHATHDPLTDLPNRAMFMRELDTSVTRARADATAHYALLFLDLDRFKHANDSFGHVQSDRLLAAIAQRLRTCLPEDGMIARLSGDEFVVLLREIHDTREAVAVAERMHAALVAPFAMRGQEIFITASIGIAPGDGDYLLSEDILRDADAAMYRAKALGKARHVVFDTAIETSARTVVQRESALRRAIERGELAAFYQPIVALDTGLPIGFEALARWHHPEHGLVLPAAFIPLAEEAGLIVAIDRWMLRKACRQLRGWDEEFPSNASLGMGVNISGTHLAQIDFVAHIKETLAETGLNPARLRLEITESTLISHTEAAASALGQLRDLGVRIVLDDFGVGYSSLNYLRQFPIDTVKIDRSFIDGAAKDATSAAIVRSVVMLAHTLGMRTVAEGIEHEEQRQRLQEVDCDFGQGFFFSGPMPAEEAGRYLSDTLYAR